MQLRRRLAPALAALAAAVVTVPLLAAPSSAAPKEPAYYLVLGDSLAYGYQSALIAADRADGDIDASNYRGYHDVVAPSLTGLVGRGRPIETVNLSCPGETVVSYPGRGGLFLDCGFSALFGDDALHHPYEGSQGAAAVAWLQEHGDDTAVVSLSIGSNDLIAILNACQQQFPQGGLPFQGCIVGGVQTMLFGLATFVGQIRALAPDATIVVFDYYNSFEYRDPSTEALAPLVNQFLGQALQGFAGVEIAGARAVINDATNNQQSFHALVGMATGDIHPTDAGYVALARALRAAVKR